MDGLRIDFIDDFMKSAIARAENDGYRLIMELRDKGWGMFWGRRLNGMVYGYIVRL